MQDTYLTNNKNELTKNAKKRHKRKKNLKELKQNSAQGTTVINNLTALTENSA